MTTKDSLPERLDRVLARFTEHVAAGKTLSPDQQKLAGRLVKALPYLERLKNARINVAQAELATEALLHSEAQLDLAREIVDDLERRIGVYKSTIRSVLEGRSPISQLLLGIGIHALLLLLPAALIVTYAGNPPAGWVVVGGALGGIVSLLIRLHEFAVVARWSPEADPKVLFFTGLLKPVVSAVLALFVWAALQTGLFTVNGFNQQAAPELANFTLAFIAGFSERLAPDIANRAVPAPLVETD